MIYVSARHMAQLSTSFLADPTGMVFTLFSGSSAARQASVSAHTTVKTSWAPKCSGCNRRTIPPASRMTRLLLVSVARLRSAKAALSCRSSVPDCSHLTRRSTPSVLSVITDLRKACMNIGLSAWHQLYSLEFLGGSMYNAERTSSSKPESKVDHFPSLFVHTSFTLVVASW